MKVFNNFFLASLIVFSHSFMSYADIAIEQGESDEKKQLFDEQNASIEVAEGQDFAGTPEYQEAMSVGKDVQSSGFVSYDDLERLKVIESLSLQQPGADVVESVAFNFEDIDLQNVADYMERVHKVKFITDDILDTNKSTQKLAGNKISYRTNAPLSKQESWSLFITFLSMAGLDVVPMSQAGFYRIVPLPGAAQEAIPAYIGSNLSLLPDNDMVIRYVYFLQNGDPLKIQPLISKFQGSTGSLMVYKDLKALIFTDKSHNIRSLMTIVKELDKPVAPQTMSVIKLKQANVEDVINLYNSLKPSSGQQRAWAQDNKDPATEFFSQNISLAGDKRTNTLIILGQKDSVSRLEDFIIKYIDIDPKTSKSPVFVYYLEYTNASDMQKTISSLVTYGSNTSAGQYGGVRGGQKYLQPMTIVADSHSNSLIVNSTAEDYPAVEKLIKELDVPQKQVALEVLIVQVTGTKRKELGSQISGPNSDNTFLRSVSGQTSGIPPASGIVTTPGGQGLAQSIKSSLSSLLLSPVVRETGSTLLTFGQPIWAVFKILKTITSTKILQNPFVVVSNNSKALVKVGTSRRVVTGEAITSSGSSSSTGYQTAEANMSVTIVPQVNDEKIINLAIAIDNNQFVNNAVNDAVQDQKSITTMAAVADGEVLVLGGIMADSDSSSTNGVPLLSKIPLLGWLFKSKANSQGKNIFIVFICPKILDNVNHQSDVQEYTRNKIEETQDYLRFMDETETIDSGQDPIDRSFFGEREKRSDDLTVDRLLKRGELVSHHEPVKRERVVGKPKNSKYHKKSKKVSENKLQKKVVAKLEPIDMSEKKSDSKKDSISSIKNMVQMSSGVSL